MQKAWLACLINLHLQILQKGLIVPDSSRMSLIILILPFQDHLWILPITGSLLTAILQSPDISFTGTDSTIKIVGHMGIILSNDKGLCFIHSTSGKAKGVTVSQVNNYYKSRFVKVIRVFNHSI